MEIKEEGTRHTLILFNCKKDMAGSIEFAAANAKSSAQLRVKGDRNNTGINQRKFVKTFVDSFLKVTEITKTPLFLFFMHIVT